MKLKLDKTSIKEIEYNIRPILAKAIKIPVEIDDIKNSIAIYVAVDPMSRLIVADSLIKEIANRIELPEQAQEQKIINNPKQ